MPSRYVTQRFTGGINQDINPVALDLRMGPDLTLDQLASASNFTFERGLMVPRLMDTDITAGSYLPAGYQVLAAAGLPTIYNQGGSGNKGLVALVYGSGSYYLYWFSTITTYPPVLGGVGLAPTQLSGPTISGLDPYNYFSNCVVNGVVLIAGSNGGLYRWDPTTNVFTQISAAPWRYVTKQFGRAIGAYNLTGPNTSGPTQIAASGTSETDWNFSAGTAYTTYLSDVSDVITGLAVIKGAVLVARTFGFHIGTPTGTYPYIYSWNLHSENAIGCAYPASLAVYKNIALFVSECGIHTFDLVDITDIGEGVYNELISFAQASGGQIRGFVAPSYKADFQPTYNLIVDNYNVTSYNGLSPHFMFNLREQKWSRHYYKAHVRNQPTPIGFSTHLSVNGQFSIPALGFFDRSSSTSKPLLWLSSVGQSTGLLVGGNTTPSFTLGKITVSSAADEAMLKRILFVFAQSSNIGTTYSSMTFSVTVAATIDGVVTTNTFTLQLTAADWSSNWVRRWLSIRMSGQFFQIYVTVNGLLSGGVWHQPVSFKLMMLEFTDEGTQRA